MDSTAHVDVMAGKIQNKYNKKIHQVLKASVLSKSGFNRSKF
jgi:hypothetical protein